MAINILVVAQRQFPLVLAAQITIVILQVQILDQVFDDPVVRVVQVPPSRSHARCVQRQVLVVKTAVKLRIFRSCSSSWWSFPCRGAEADFHGPCDHSVSPGARGYGGRGPIMHVVQIS